MARNIVINNTYELKFDTSCSNTYNFTQAKAGTHFEFSPARRWWIDEKRAFAFGRQTILSFWFSAEFMWMHLDKAPVTLSYTPPANNATGFHLRTRTIERCNWFRYGYSRHSVNYTTAQDEIIIAGEVYKETALRDFLNNTKKVVAYAPIPILHTNKYELPQYAGESDVR